jgi:hypothetical protein
MAGDIGVMSHAVVLARRQSRRDAGRDLGALVSYEGEEVAIVMSGGDCAYFDSAVGHELFLVGRKTAEVFGFAPG